MTIGTNIKNIRKEKNLNQEDFAKEINISQSYLSDLENDRKNISTKTLESLSKKLSVSMKYLTTGEKALSDLSEDEIESAFKQFPKEDIVNWDDKNLGVWENKTSKLKNRNLDTINYFFENIEKNSLSIIETQFLTNSIIFLKNSNKNEINFMQVLLLQLNKYNKSKRQNYSERNINNVYDDLHEEFNKFLKQYLNIK